MILDGWGIGDLTKANAIYTAGEPNIDNLKAHYPHSQLMSKEGYGFVRVEGREDDIYIPARKMRGALNGDTVAILTASGVSASKKREGRGGSVARESSLFVGKSDGV